MLGGLITSFVWLLLVMLIPQPYLSIRRNMTVGTLGFIADKTKREEVPKLGEKDKGILELTWLAGQEQRRKAVIRKSTKLANDAEACAGGTLKLVLAVRHGESVGNIVSQSMKNNWKMKKYLSLMWDGLRLPFNLLVNGVFPDLKTGATRDSPLTIGGLYDMRQVGRGLFGKKRDTDLFGFFNDDGDLQNGITVLFSPLRRTISTTIEIFGTPVQNYVKKKTEKKDHIVFKAEPLAHERLKTLSDLGSGRDALVKHAKWHWKWFGQTGNVAKQMEDSIKTMKQDWYKDCYPTEEEDTASKVKGDVKDDEDEVFFEERMGNLMKSISDDPRDVIILVTHSKVTQSLFQDFFKDRDDVKPDNGCVLAGKFCIWEEEDQKGERKTKWADQNREMEFNTQSRRFPFTASSTSEIPYLMQDTSSDKKKKDKKIKDKKGGKKADKL